jgi:hypothetical protein
MTRAFDCGICVPRCRLETDEDGIEPPTACPWSTGVNAPAWRAADYGEAGPA